MENIITDSSGLVRNTGWCLICCSAYPEVNLTPSNPNLLTKATEKLFEYLLIPKEHLANVKKKCLLSFCPNCMIIVDEIIELQKKAEILELQIQRKAETLGRIAIDTPAFTRISGRDQKKVAEIWRIFKSHVTQNFLDGLLPNPSVRLGKTVKIKPKAVAPNANLNDGHKFQNSKIPDFLEFKTKSKTIRTNTGGENPTAYQSSSSTISQDDIESEMTENIMKEEAEDYYSNEVLPETEPCSASTCYKYPNDEVGDSVFQPLDLPSDDTSYDEITIESQIWVGNTGQDVEDMNETFDYSQDERASKAEKNTEGILATESVSGLKRRRGPGRPKKFSNFVTNDETFGIDVKKATDPGKEFEIVKTNDSDFNRNSTHNRPKRQKMSEVSTRPADFDNSVIGIRACRLIKSIKDPDVIQKENEVLVQERDYVKCTKCDYVAKNVPTNGTLQNWRQQPRQRVAAHYSKHHNPVKPTKTSKTFKGKDCYRCTMCSFSIIFKSNFLPIRYHYHQKLSLHYMDVHDASGSQSNSKMEDKNLENPVAETTARTIMNIKDPDEIKNKIGGSIGPDCIKCTKCDYFVKKGAISHNYRRKVYDHYGRHHNPVKSTDKSKISNGKFCYRCTKCSFSIVYQQRYATAHTHYYQKLSLHYMEVHDSIEDNCNSENNDIISKNIEKKMKSCAEATLIKHELISRRNNSKNKVFIGRDYFKCTKCDFFANKTERNRNNENNPSMRRRRVAEHYGRDHNPVNISDKYKTSNGKYCYRCTKCSFAITFEPSTPTRLACNYRKLSLHYMEVHDASGSQPNYKTEEINLPESIVETTTRSITNTRTLVPLGLRKTFKGLNEGDTCFKCTKCPYYAANTSTSKYTASMLRFRVTDHYNRHHNPVNATVTDEDKTISGKYFYKCTKCTFSTVSKSNTPSGLRKCYNKLSVHYMEVHDSLENISSRSNDNEMSAIAAIPTANIEYSRDSGEVQRQLEGLTEGKNYMKCTKCDYFVKRTPTSVPCNIRAKLANHYGELHNPVKSTDKSKLINGKYCYRCTKCSFSTIFQPNTASGYKYYYRKLSLHYMEIHDSVENQSNLNIDTASKTIKREINSTVEVPTKRALITLGDISKNRSIKGRDFFKCTKCDFFANKSVSNRSYENNPSYRRRRVAEHYGSNHNPVKMSNKYKTGNGKYCYRCTKCSFSIVFELRTAAGHQYYYRKLSLHFMEVHDRLEGQSIPNNDEISAIVATRASIEYSRDNNGAQNAQEELEGLTEGKDYFKCTKCDYFFKKDPSISVLKNCPSTFRFKVAAHYSIHHNPVKPSNKFKTTNGKYCYRCTKCSFSSVFQSHGVSGHQYYHQKLSLHYMEVHDVFGESQPISNNQHSKEIHRSAMTVNIEGDEGKDYFKCTKCDYVAKKCATNTTLQNFPSALRIKVAHHYSVQHNPVKSKDKSEISDGKYCYKCTKCSFSIIFTQRGPTGHQGYHRRLSMHYMEVHDVAEKDSNIETTSLTEGKDYFSCPVENCTYLALIKNSECPRQQLNNGIKARQDLIEHYRTFNSEIHNEERKETLEDIFNTQLVDDTLGNEFYKCSKCDFKSFVGKLNRFPTLLARKVLIVHFLQEHFLPWEKLPGLYKYGCYQEKSEDGNVLKCVYSDCDYFINIRYDLEEKNQEECQLVAYQLFTEHALNHNFNSIRLTDINLITAKKVLDSKVGSDIKAKGLRNNSSAIFQSLNTSTNLSTANTLDEGISTGSKVWLGDIAKTFQKETPELELMKSDIEIGLKRLRSKRSVRPTRYMDFATGDELSDTDIDNTIEPERECEISEAGSYFHPGPSHAGRKRRKLHSLSRASTDMENSELDATRKSISETKDSHEDHEHLEGLKEGRNYFKCTKCDYFVQKMPSNPYSQNCPSVLKRKLATHYSAYHNPVTPAKTSSTNIGKCCYRCTKCSFSVVYQSNTATAHAYNHEKLSSHYMEVHDDAENESNSHSEDIVTTSLTEGIDYYSCPIENCTFLELIKKENSPKQQLQNATEARYKIIQHFTHAHVEQRIDILTEISKTLLVNKSNTEQFYKCSQCDFKSFIRKDLLQSSAPREVLEVHYLHEHLFPWEKFPGFYKYGCYQEKSEGENYLKCPYSDCDYFIKMHLDLEGKNQEECQVAAYQFFTVHAINHNFNSTTFYSDVNCSGKRGEKSASENPDINKLIDIGNENNDGQIGNSVYNMGQDIQKNIKEEDIAIVQSPNDTINPLNIIEMTPEEVTVESKVWLDEHYEEEEVEEMNLTTVIESQEITITAEENKTG